MSEENNMEIIIRNFVGIFLNTRDEVREKILECQNMDHTQQVAWSTYHDAMTQVCFTCGKVRTSINKQCYKN